MPNGKGHRANRCYYSVRKRDKLAGKATKSDKENTMLNVLIASNDKGITHVDNDLSNPTRSAWEAKSTAAFNQPVIEHGKRTEYPLSKSYA